MKFKYYFWLIPLCFLLGSCGLIYSIAYSHYEKCKIKINKQIIKGRCDLVNGLQFQKLSVLKKDDNGIPQEYYITDRYACKRKTKSTKRKFRIKLGTSSKYYDWGSDTTDIFVGENNTKSYAIGVSDNTIPLKFSKDSWYYMYSPFLRGSGKYVYVDDKMKVYVRSTD